MQNQLSRYIAQKRQHPTHLVSIDFPSKIQNEESESGLIDFMMVFLRKFNHQIPSWNGFNYLLQDDSDER